jgi:hypothetical protein
MSGIVLSVAGLAAAPIECNRHLRKFGVARHLRGYPKKLPLFASFVIALSLP